MDDEYTHICVSALLRQHMCICKGDNNHVTSFCTEFWLQAKEKLMRSLGWSSEPAACVDLVQGLFQRAQMYADGQRAARDAKKEYVPDWQAMNKADSMQAQLAEKAVRCCA